RGEMDDDAEGEHYGARALRDPEPGFDPRAHSSPFIAALRTARLSPEIPAVGEMCFGQRSVQLRWVWQAWQPASPATARSRSAFPASRSSQTSVHARLSAAGPR